MILLTGGLGFIGSHIALSLMAQGQEVVLVDNLSNANMQTLQRLEYISNMYVPFMKVDIRNTPALNKVFEQYSIDAVIHAAGFKSLQESVMKPLEYYNDNVSCIMSLLRSMQRMGVRNLVHLSSLTVYGQSSCALHEDLAIHYNYPNPYVKSQQMIEEIIKDTFKTDNEWRIALLRIGNVAGAFEHGVLGEWVAPLPKNIVPLAMQVAAEQREYLELHQTDQTSDHSAERSFLHVLDLCDAVGASLNWLSQQNYICEPFNIAGNMLSMQQLIDLMEGVTGKTIKTIQGANMNESQFAQLASQSDKAEKILKWKAKHSHEKMIEDAWRYYQRILKN